ncbi:hypothetical protein QCA50_009162 [Cerrena zonata]|uniref:BEN domain-containing protein n=1 Tax=Cerrena zonata TaxID=2478898 RepID=A0AAW0G3N4_9APHY
MSTEAEVDLKEELEVSRNIIRMLMKDLMKAENKIKELEVTAAVAAMNPTTPVPDHTAEEAVKRTSSSRWTTINEDSVPSEAEVPACSNVKLEFQEVPSADVIIEQLQAQCDQLLEERSGLQELANQAQDNSRRAKRYKEKNMSLKQEIDSMTLKYQESEVKLNSMFNAIASYIRLSDRSQKENHFSPKTFLKMRHNIQAPFHQEETVNLTNDSHDLVIPKQAQRLLKRPDRSPLRLRDDDGTMWSHPSGSHLLSLNPTYTYNTDDATAKYHMHPSIPQKNGFQTDVFCFHTQEGVWKYYGIFAYAGLKMVTLKQAREELLVPEETIELIKRRSGAPQHEWVDQMYTEGVFKILCVGLKRTGFNHHLLSVLNQTSRVTASIPETSRGGQSKRRNSSVSEEQVKEKRARGNK